MRQNSAPPSSLVSVCREIEKTSLNSENLSKLAGSFGGKIKVRIQLTKLIAVHTVMKVLGSERF